MAVIAAYAMGRYGRTGPTVEDMRRLYPQVVNVECVRWSPGGGQYQDAELMSYRLGEKHASASGAGKEIKEGVQILGTINEQPFSAFLRVEQP